MIRVVLAHPQPLVREGLRKILGTASSVKVVGQAATTEEAVAAAREHNPDIVLMDAAIPGLDELDAIRRPHLADARIPLIILGVQHESVGAPPLARAGALGYVAAQSEPAELLEAVRTVHRGQHYVCRYLKYALERSRLAGHHAPHPLARLSRRERQVFRLLVKGASTREIAAALRLSCKTVSVHRGHVLTKLGLHNNAELTRFAFEHELLGK